MSRSATGSRVRPRVGIDCRLWKDPRVSSPTGVERTIFWLVEALLQRETVPYTLVLFFAADQQIPATYEQRPFVECIRLPRPSVWPLVGPHLAVARAFSKARLDVLHAPATTVPLGYAGKTVVTVHDLYIYEYPEWFPARQGLSTRWVIPRAIRRAERCIVPSEAVAEQVRRQFSVSSDRLAVVPHGVEPVLFDQDELNAAWESFSEEAFFERPFVVFVGTLEPRKNVQRLVEAFTKVVQSYPDLQLVLVGKEGWGLPEGFLEALPKSVSVVGYSSDVQKRALLSRAKVFAFPSLAEGFGLPLLEALQQGVPVVTSDRAPMHRVAGPGAVLVDPESVASIQGGIETALSRTPEENTRCVQQGLEWVGEYTWERAAKQTLTVYEQVLQS